MEEKIEKDYWDDWGEGGGEESRFLASKRTRDKPISGSVNKPRPLTTDD